MEQEQEEGYLIYCDSIEGQRISEGEAKVEQIVHN